MASYDPINIEIATVWYLMIGSPASANTPGEHQLT